MSVISELTKGLYKENPTFRIVLGLCPVLAVTTSLKKRHRNGACHNTCACVFKFYDISFQKYDSE